MTKQELKKLMQDETERYKDKECKVVAMAIGCQESLFGINDYLNYPIIFRKCVNCENEIYIDVLEYYKSDSRMYSMKSIRLVDHTDMENAIILLQESYQLYLGDVKDTMFLIICEDSTDDSLFETWCALIKFREDRMRMKETEKKKYKTRLDILNKFMVSIAFDMRMLERYSSLPEYENEIPVPVRVIMKNIAKKYRKANGCEG